MLVMRLATAAIGEHLEKIFCPCKVVREFCLVCGSLSTVEKKEHCVRLNTGHWLEYVLNLLGV